MRGMLGATKRFRAKVDRTSVRKGSNDKVVCLQDLSLDGVVIKQHAWVEKHSTFVNIVKGDVIEFSARIAQYLSVNDKYEQVTKYKLVKIRNLRRV